MTQLHVSLDQFLCANSVLLGCKIAYHFGRGVNLDSALHDPDPPPLADTANDIQLLPGLVLSATNHEGTGPRRASGTGSISAYGAIDMAGNVREW